MLVYSGNGLGDFYYKLIRDITENGRKVDMGPGKGVCLELPEPVTLVYDNPGYCWMKIPHRKWNPFFAIAEVIWILSGSGSVDWISYFNESMRTWQDGSNFDFHGAYGLRIRRWEDRDRHGNPGRIDQISKVVNKLQKDPNSRQAVISLWDPELDNSPSKDIPCNNWVGYTLRNGLLDQTVVIRSNDLVWGTPYNAVQFTHIQAYVAGLLKVGMGRLTYVVNNLHYYMDLYKSTLANLIDQAYNEALHPLQAECYPGFRSIYEDELQECIQTVAGILATWRHSKEEVSPLNLQKHLMNSSSSYFTFDYPLMFWIYTILKSGKLASAKDVAYVANQFDSLEEPLRSLMADFYEGTKNQNAIAVLEELKVRR